MVNLHTLCFRSCFSYKIYYVLQNYIFHVAYRDDFSIPSPLYCWMIILDLVSMLSLEYYDLSVCQIIVMEILPGSL